MFENIKRALAKILEPIIITCEKTISSHVTLFYLRKVQESRSYISERA